MAADDDSLLIVEMRTLHLLGVTNFVVKDGLLERLRGKVSRDIALLAPGDTEIIKGYAPDETPLYFRGHRILTQADLKHLPFDTFRPAAGSTRTQADFDAEFKEASES